MDANNLVSKKQGVQRRYEVKAGNKCPEKVSLPLEKWPINEKTGIE